MRIFVASDVHESKKRLDIPKPDADVAVIAGDIEAPWFLERHRDAWDGIPILAVMGNHDYYKTVFPDRRRFQVRGVRILEREAWEFGGVVFLGTTLWSSPPPTMHMEVHNGIMDFQKIGYRRRLFSVQDMCDENELCVNWLKNRLRHYEREKVVVVTHFLPCDFLIDRRFKGDRLNCYFSAGLDAKILDWSMPAVWISGHSHARHDVKIGGTRFVANPAGYPGAERRGFNPGKVIEI